MPAIAIKPLAMSVASFPIFKLSKPGRSAKRALVFFKYVNLLAKFDKTWKGTCKRNRLNPVPTRRFESRTINTKLHFKNSFKSIKETISLVNVNPTSAKMKSNLLKIV